MLTNASGPRRNLQSVELDRLRDLEELADDLRDLALVLARQATDTGERVSLDEVLAALGYTRESLERLPT